MQTNPEMESPAEDADEAPEQGGDTLFIPPDHVPDADSLKPGDTREITFVGKDKDGDLEWQYGASEAPEESMGDEMKRTIDNPAPEAGMKGQY